VAEWSNGQVVEWLSGQVVSQSPAEKLNETLQIELEKSKVPLNRVIVALH
jgi:hypothetical protein